MKITLTFLFAALVVAAPTDGAGESYRAEIERYFDLAKVGEKYEVAMVAGFDAGLGMAQLDAMPPERREKFERAFNRVLEMMHEEIGWAAVKEDMIEMYSGVFTLDELKAINEILAQPAMQTMIEKEIEMLPKSMEFSQARMMELLPKIQSIMVEEMSK